jgi:hypothetical protein
MSSRAITACLWIGVASAPALAQGPYVAPNPNANNPYARPFVSPYINLFRSNNPGIQSGINFVGIVRPEFQLYGDVGQLQRQVNQLQTAAATGEPLGNLPSTGHPVAFQNLSHFYGTGAGGAGRRPGTVTPTFPQGGQGTGTGTAGGAAATFGGGAGAQRRQ